MANINWTAEGESWLKEIYSYIAQDRPDSAINIVEGFVRKWSCYGRFRILVLAMSQNPRMTFGFCCMGTTGLRILSNLMRTLIF